jgi:NAD(P)-dependent dehydrogenase (short-subunit alcohol dehydrogenase family)
MTVDERGTTVDLSGKVAVVTGSGQGVGAAEARALAAAGAAVVVNDVDAAAAESVVKAITGDGGRAVAQVGAVGSTETAVALVERAVSEVGKLDVMVTNAGILRDKTLWNMADEDFDAVIHVHLRGTFTCAREAARHFRQRGEGGRLILTGSPTGQRGNFGQGNYAAAKAGIVGMCRTWAMELAKAKVTVNAIVPTAATAMTKTIPFLAPYVEAMERGEPIPSVVRRAALGRRRRRDRADPGHRWGPAIAVVAPDRDTRGVPRRRLGPGRDRRGGPLDGGGEP